MLRIDPQTYLFWALLLLLFPLNWLSAVFLAAIFHELCHVLAVKLLKGNIRNFHVHWNGCVLEVDRFKDVHQFVSILAGPLGSLSLVLLHRIAPRIAVCGFFQGIYNLIPLLPLDGGRLLRHILYHVCPERSEIIMQGIELVLRVCIMIGILLLIVSRILNPLPGIILAIWNIRLTMRKFPCKPFKIGVQ